MLEYFDINSGEINTSISYNGVYCLRHSTRLYFQKGFSTCVSVIINDLELEKFCMMLDHCTKYKEYIQYDFNSLDEKECLIFFESEKGGDQRNLVIRQNRLEFDYDVPKKHFDKLAKHLRRTITRKILR